MRKNVFGRKLKRTTNQRKGLFRSLMRSMILHGRIKTTEAKAKAVRPELEKLVTRARNQKEGAKRELLKHLPHEEIVQKLITDIAPQFDGRPGGYTRIIRLGNRLKDNASMVYLEWTETGIQSSEVNAQEEKKSTKKTMLESARAAINLPEKKEEKKKSSKKKG